MSKRTAVLKPSEVVFGMFGMWRCPLSHIAGKRVEILEEYVDAGKYRVQAGGQELWVDKKYFHDLKEEEVEEPKIISGERAVFELVCHLMGRVSRLEAAMKTPVEQTLKAQDEDEEKPIERGTMVWGWCRKDQEKNVPVIIGRYIGEDDSHEHKIRLPNGVMTYRPCVRPLTIGELKAKGEPLFGRV